MQERRITKRRTIKFKLMGAILALTGLMVALLAGALYAFAGRQARAALGERAEMVAGMLAFAVNAGLEFSDADAAKKALGATETNPEVIFVQVTDAQGQTVASYLDEKLAAKNYDTAGLQTDSSVLVAEKSVVSTIGSGELGKVQVALSTDSIRRSLARSLGLSLGVAALVGIVGLAIALLLSRSITAPLGEVGNALRRLAAGDFTARVDIRSNDELAELGGNLNRMVEQVRPLIVRITEVSTQLFSEGKELSSAASHLAQSADSQNRMSAESASTVEQLSQSAESVFGASKGTSERCEGAREAAHRGATALRPALAGIEEMAAALGDASRVIAQLEQKSNDIKKITSLIQEISSQTNLLALNAAIEAARAGEAGRGFEVVASEVRKLAESSASSSTQIYQILESIRSDVGHAAHSMQDLRERTDKSAASLQEADRSFQEIANAVDSAAALSADMLHVAQEQAASTDQTSTHLETILSESRSVASQAQELAHTVESLNGISGHLQEVVSTFQL
ncbi:MAG: methyl-accepting chemotaxis protein [Bdellovibrionota bacterium]